MCISPIRLIPIRFLIKGVELISLKIKKTYSAFPLVAANYICGCLSKGEVLLNGLFAGMRHSLYVSVTFQIATASH